ncbi:MAG: hypothetical protein EPO65_05810 [Dehalococcoidia bacterium]|nr:MAG: hypothetical protein EPO65_05810 [Dehalococcoidia bacterium]
MVRHSPPRPRTPVHPILLFVTVLVILVVAPVAVGLMLPVRHTVTRRIVIQRPREQIWARIVDFAGQTAWRPDVKRPVRLDDHDGHEVWREAGDLALETVETLPPERLTRRVVANRMFGGTWTVTLRQAPGGTEVAVTESGEVYHPLFRTISKFVIGHDRAVRAYLTSLARSFGEDGNPSKDSDE